MDQLVGRLTLGRARRLRQTRLDNEPVPVLGERMTHVGEPRLLAFAFPKQACLAIRRRDMRRV